MAAALHPVTLRGVNAVLSNITKGQPIPHGITKGQPGHVTAIPRATAITKGQPGHVTAIPRGTVPGLGGAPTAPQLPAPSSPTTGSPPGAAAPTAAAPFLTPAQKMALDAFDNRYNASVTGINQRSGENIVNTNAQLAAAAKARDVSTSMANQNAAARGLFQSSIRDGTLNDIDTAMVSRDNVLNTALRTANLTARSNLASLAASYATTHNYYNTLAVDNAAAIPPSTDGTTTPAAAGVSPAPSGGSPAPSGASAAPSKAAPRVERMTPTLPQVGTPAGTAGFQPTGLPRGESQGKGLQIKGPKMPKGGGRVQGGPVFRGAGFGGASQAGPPGMGA